MKRETGIELVSALPANSLPTFGTLSQWYVLGGKCRRCGHESWIDRWALEKLYGRDKYLAQLQGALRCTKCGAKGGNEWIIGKVRR